MKRTERWELETLLRDAAPGPPPGLRESILEEIPPQLQVRTSAGQRSWPRWALAASLAAALVGGWMAREVRQSGSTEDAAGGSASLAVAEREADAPVAVAPPSEPAPAPPVAPARSGKIAQTEAREQVSRPVPVAEVLRQAEEPYRVAEAAGRPQPVQAVEVPPAVLEESLGAGGGVEGGVAGGVAGGMPGVEAARSPVAARAAKSQAPPSTGGTREPNDRPYGDVFYQDYGTNPFIDAAEDPLSTFGLDVDTASYAVARRYLADGHLPPPEAVRVEEFVNAMPLAAPRARRGGELVLDVEGAPTPFVARAADRYRVVRFTVAAPRPERLARRPAVLTFVVDTSGSMEREDRLELVKRALGLLLDELAPEDRVGLVVYDDRARVICEPTPDRERVRQVLERLRPGGSTNAEDGLALGYEVADRAYLRGGVNRVLLASDGVANVGATGPQAILERIGRAARRGIYLTTVGFGMGNYNDVLMEQLADRGDGNYAYVDTLEEARRIFREGLEATLVTVARDAKVQVEFDPEVVERYRLLGYENRDLADRQFRDDQVDAGELGAGHVVTALYEVKLRPPGWPARSTLAVLRVRYRPVGADGEGEVHERAVRLRLADLASEWEAASADLRWAATAAQFAELLKGTPWAKEDRWPDLVNAARGVAREIDGERGARAREFADWVERAARLAADRVPHPEGAAPAER